MVFKNINRCSINTLSNEILRRAVSTKNILLNKTNYLLFGNGIRFKKFRVSFVKIDDVLLIFELKLILKKFNRIIRKKKKKKIRLKRRNNKTYNFCSSHQ